MIETAAAGAPSRESIWGRLLRPWLRLPPPPGPPRGDEGNSTVFRAAPNFIRYRLFVTAIGSGFFMLLVFGPLFAVWVAMLLSERIAGGLVFLAIVSVCLVACILFVLLGFAAVYVDYENRYYIVTNRSLRIREGVFLIREMTVTFANIQNISVSQGPVQRALGLADLRVDTAGGGGAAQAQHGMMSLHTAWFRGVARAAEIRDVIQQRLRAQRDSGLGDADDEPAELEAESASFSDIVRDLREEAAALRLTLRRTRGETG